MKKWQMNILLAVLWVIAGVVVLSGAEVSKFSYGILLTCYVLTLAGDAFIDYMDEKHPKSM